MATLQEALLKSGLVDKEEAEAVEKERVKKLREEEKNSVLSFSKSEKREEDAEGTEDKL